MDVNQLYSSCPEGRKENLEIQLAGRTQAFVGLYVGVQDNNEIYILRSRYLQFLQDPGAKNYLRFSCKFNRFFTFYFVLNVNTM